MAVFYDPKFIIYTRGYYLDQLCLGHLVLGPWFTDPVDRMNFCCHFPRIAEQDESSMTRSSDWRGRVLVEEGSNFALSVEALDLVKVGPALQKNRVKLLEAGKGRRVELRDPAAFLEQTVLPTGLVRRRIQTWLSVLRTEFLFKQFFRRRPRIWMVTALYELEDVRTYSVSRKQLSGELGISSILTAALGGVSLGGSIEVGASRLLTSEGEVKQRMVYAARWQLLQANYLETGSALNLSSIVLHPDDVYSMGSVMGGDDDEENELEGARVASLECGESGTEEMEAEKDLPDGYWDAFEVAQELLLASI